ncbi:hypothetical protein VNO77_10514 [Canavalia gladiata]|uniref:Uncharacterized protein n=1 Tax=Canavalia gladiata TaxID=3824 RepID=A0AAN9MBW0_CANGL
MSNTSSLFQSRCFALIMKKLIINKYNNNKGFELVDRIKGVYKKQLYAFLQSTDETMIMISKLNALEEDNCKKSSLAYMHYTCIWGVR